MRDSIPSSDGPNDSAAWIEPGISIGSATSSVPPAIVGGDAADAWTALTGKSADSILAEGKTNQELFDGIKQAFAVAGDQVIIGTSDAFKQLHGVYGNHAYVVEGVVDTEGAQEVKLYNPWGREHAILRIDQLSDVLAGYDVLHSLTH